MRKYLMAGNWKMNKTISEAIVLTQQLCNQYNRKWDNVDIVICPPAIDIKSVYTVIDFDKTNIAIGAQNVHWEESGAFTGEISIPMIKEAGCEYCIVGHSERREMFNETDTTVNQKVKALIEAEIAPIVCVGESLAMRDSGDYGGFSWLRRNRHEECCCCVRANLGDWHRSYRNTRTSRRSMQCYSRYTQRYVWGNGS